MELEEPMPSLTPEQREALALAIGREGYARIDDYVVLKAEVYDRLRAAADDGLDMIQVGSLVESTMREEDAGDPLARQLPELSAMIRRGDVVIVDFPFTDQRAAKVRPALVGSTMPTTTGGGRRSSP